ncbi:MAG: hypothetical protein C4548_01200 [Desulfobacteraceae bacterium]|nr:MAG: hypothetical protein C4548_01200 [Desulfobacteraceae bacterium]
MLRTLLKYRFLISSVCFLTFLLPSATFLLPTAIAGVDRINGRDESGSKTCFFNFAGTSPSSAFLADREQIRTKKFDNSSSVFPGRNHLVFNRKPSPFLYDAGLDVIDSACHSVIPIRAPPSRNS